jgi:hypothetical protein
VTAAVVVTAAGMAGVAPVMPAMVTSMMPALLPTLQPALQAAISSGRLAGPSVV